MKTLHLSEDEAAALLVALSEGVCSMEEKDAKHRKVENKTFNAFIPNARLLEEKARKLCWEFHKDKMLREAMRNANN